MSDMPRVMCEWNDALKQIEYEAHECEAGPITSSAAYQWLQKLLNAGPKFLMGQGVYMEALFQGASGTIKQECHFYIVGIQMDSDTERRTYTYDLSNDPPSPWHYGEVQHRGVFEKSIAAVQGEGK